MIDEADLPSRIARVTSTFSPSAPIDRRNLFAGRIDQLSRVFDAVGTRGQHAAIFGERGVGKTSLANIVKDIAQDNDPSCAVVKINCSKDDTFLSVWRKALAEIELVRDTGKTSLGLKSVPLDDLITADQLLPENPSPNDIRRVLDRLGSTVLVLDEFDRVPEEATALFADTIKTLSDSSTSSTIVLVGVARNINDLIKEHLSIERALKQIQMPRMDQAELHEILTKAMNALSMSMEANARTLIVLLSQGLPHYTHVLGKVSSIHALRNGRLEVSEEDVRQSIKAAIDNTDQSIRQSYQEATASSRKESIFEEVLLACALAEVDDLGYFTSAAVRQPLRDITGKPYDIPSFSQHLNDFSSATRGHVLEKAGTTRRFRFRFANPLLQPFVIMRGITDGSLQGDLLKLLQRKWQH